ncbi:MAG: response regulator [Deltaproteobacteria bacterium]|nr:response regulator [Deltaproteobacteria bacterium]
MAPKQILVVEDEFNTRFAIDFVLSKAGYETAQAQTGAEALSILKERVAAKKSFDLMVTDIQMPGMNGIELIDEMRKISGALPVLVITGFGDKKMLVELLRRGCADYLDKPFSPDALIEVVSCVLNKCESAQQTCENGDNQLIKTDRKGLIGELAPQIVHEINNTSQVIQGYAELLLENKATDAATKKIASSIYDAVQATVQLNRQILDIARPKGLQMTNFTPEAPLEKAVSFLTGAGIFKRCTMKRNYQENLPPLRGDFQQLNQAFLNLLVNAYNAMQQSSLKTVTLTIGHVAEANMVSISIEDTGCGIPPENYRKIFESYFTTRLAEGGTGLGLAVVKHIVECHGGTIEIMSRVGRGSIFTLRLPAAQKTTACIHGKTNNQS